MSNIKRFINTFMKRLFLD